MRCLVVGVCVLMACMPHPEPGARSPRQHALVIAVQPLADVPHELLDSARVAIETRHSATVLTMPQRELPGNAFTKVRTPRYRADTLIAWLRGIRPDSVDLIIGITDKDISITKHDSTGAIKAPAWKYRDFGVFGLGYIGGPSCMVSTYRLGNPDGQRYFDRLKKIVVHELGHNRALPHCPDTACVMRDAVERISSIDAAGASFCAACLQRLDDGKNGGR